VSLETPFTSTGSVASAETIVALASGLPPSGVAVIRVSGPAAPQIAEAITGRPLPPARLAALRRFCDPASGELLDVGLLLWFAAPHSFTGDDVVEFQVHGSPAGVRDLLATICAAHKWPSGIDCRLAQPGEFTRRAFFNGCIDLSEVEALADLVRAETSAQRRQALSNTAGHSRKRLAAWRDRLTETLTLLEAAIDFADEELPDTLMVDAATLIESVKREAAVERDRALAGETLRRGLYIAIIGPPNVGKSSLLNALADRDAAIVSSIAGTTRDVVEISLELGGYPVIVADTAGLREVDNEIETEGIERARRVAAEADLTLVVGDAREMTAPGTSLPDAAARTVIRVWNKVDLVADGCRLASSNDLVVSACDRNGLDDLRRRLVEEAKSRLSPGEDSIVLRQRHREAVNRMIDALDLWGPSLPAEIQSFAVQTALRELAALAGRVDVEDVLGRIFGEFCIGK